MLFGHARSCCICLSCEIYNEFAKQIRPKLQKGLLNSLFIHYIFIFSVAIFYLPGTGTQYSPSNTFNLNLFLNSQTMQKVFLHLSIFSIELPNFNSFELRVYLSLFVVKCAHNKKYSKCVYELHLNTSCIPSRS